nr:hypothetical protein [Tanacetum cinerariifolium]
EFNANDVFDIGIDVIDTEEFESASDEYGIERIRSRKMKQLKKHNSFKEGSLQKSRKIKYYTADFFSEDVIDQIETNPEIPVKAIQEQLQRKFQLEVSRMKTFREKEKVVDNFLRFDGTFMKGPFPGQLLTAVGMDPNNGIYPLAYGIVEAESMKS